MVPLQNVYVLRGRPNWTYKIMKREGDVVMVEMHGSEKIKNNNGEMDRSTLEGYEVFVVQKYPERPRPDGKGMIPSKELPPPDYYWGTYGHSFPPLGLEKAELQYQQDLISQQIRIEKRKLKNNESSKPSKSKKTSKTKVKK